MLELNLHIILDQVLYETVLVRTSSNLSKSLFKTEIRHLLPSRVRTERTTTLTGIKVNICKNIRVMRSISCRGVSNVATNTKFPD